MSSGRLSITVQAGRDLTELEKWFTVQDPYYILTLGTQEFRSKVVQDGGKQPVWNQESTFFIRDETELKVKVWNYNNKKSDTVIGIGSYDLRQVMAMGEQSCQIPLRSVKDQPAGYLVTKMRFTTKSSSPQCHTAPPPNFPGTHQYQPQGQISSHVPVPPVGAPDYYPTPHAVPQFRSLTDAKYPSMNGSMRYPQAQETYPSGQGPYTPVQTDCPPTQAAYGAAQGHQSNSYFSSSHAPSSPQAHYNTYSNTHPTHHHAPLPVTYDQPHQHQPPPSHAPPGYPIQHSDSQGLGSPSQTVDSTNPYAQFSQPNNAGI